MLKVKQSNNSKLKKYVKKFGENIFSTDGFILYYKICDVKVSSKNIPCRAIYRNCLVNFVIAFF